MSNDFDFDEDDFDPDSVIGEDERFAELDAFLMCLKELQEKPHIRIINPVRMKEFQYACGAITKAVLAENPDTKIRYSINECDTGEGNIEITADEISANDLKGFISGLKMARNFEIHPLLDGNIQMNILFHGVLASVKLSPEED